MPLVPEGLAGYKSKHVATLAEILSARPDMRPGNHALMAVLLAAVTETVSVILVHATPDRFGRDEMLDEASRKMALVIAGKGRAAGMTRTGERFTPPA